MKRKVVLSLVLVLLISMTMGCASKAGKDFKEEYESVNGKENAKGSIHRVIEIPEDNPYEKITTAELLKKIDKKETFYVYFGDKLCPWCRSVIEKSIEVAKDKKVKKIYYINIWDDEGNEILRDKYELVDGKLKKTIKGTDDYKKLLKIFDKVLTDYNLTDEKGEKISTGEKRIFAPNYMFVEKGKVKSLVTGISEKQKESREELTDEILKDEAKIFKDFFKK